MHFDPQFLQQPPDGIRQPAIIPPGTLMVRFGINAAVVAAGGLATLFAVLLLAAESQKRLALGRQSLGLVCLVV